MLTRVCAALIALLLISVPSAWATDRYYSDRDVSSSEGLVRFTAVSPDNAGPRPRPFADDFVYTLYDKITGKTVWTRNQPAGEGSPKAARVHNDGWVVLWTSRDQIVILDKDVGHVRARYSIIDQFDRSEQAAHVHPTTAGPMWAAFARLEFFDHEGEVYFVIRTGWGKHLIAHVKTGQFIPDNDPVAVAYKADVNAWALATLETHLQEPAQLSMDQRNQASRETMRAIVTVAGNRTPGAVELLRKAEAVDIAKPTAITMDMVLYFPGDRIYFQEHRIRLAAQMALRLLGEEPAPLPSTSVLLNTAADVDRQVIAEELAQPRHEGAEQIAAGMGLLDVLRLIGPPDNEIRWSPVFAWEWHINSDEPYTLRLDFDASGNATDIEIIRPPIWQDGGQWFERIR